uniref:Uncharacterized protein n=1 Tax=viral metagenome TaxID=1070528 RepID=A0A2V0R9T2_9ZZZZ
MRTGSGNRDDKFADINIGGLRISINKVIHVPLDAFEAVVNSIVEEGHEFKDPITDFSFRATDRNVKGFSLPVPYGLKVSIKIAWFKKRLTVFDSSALSDKQVEGTAKYTWDNKNMTWGQLVAAFVIYIILVPKFGIKILFYLFKIPLKKVKPEISDQPSQAVPEVKDDTNLLKLVADSMSTASSLATISRVVAGINYSMSDLDNTIQSLRPDTAFIDTAADLTIAINKLNEILTRLPIMF